MIHYCCFVFVVFFFVLLVVDYVITSSCLLLILWEVYESERPRLRLPACLRRLAEEGFNLMLSHMHMQARATCVVEERRGRAPGILNSSVASKRYLSHGEVGEYIYT